MKNRGILTKMNKTIGDATVGLPEKSGGDMVSSIGESLARLEALSDTMPQGDANRRGKISSTNSEFGNANRGTTVGLREELGSANRGGGDVVGDSLDSALGAASGDVVGGSMLGAGIGRLGVGAALGASDNLICPKSHKAETTQASALRLPLTTREAAINSGRQRSTQVSIWAVLRSTQVSIWTILFTVQAVFSSFLHSPFSHIIMLMLVPKEFRIYISALLFGLVHSVLSSC
ncbi:unnamed protein product [Ilex paraguariensis]|uniref:Uncharacterized protein n=1 Tax=Ilex paraguariensis TaxID=185542 RepID=A0ABC8RSS7_9AQUA